MRRAGVAYVVPGALALVLVSGVGFATGEAMSSSPASADTTLQTVTVARTVTLAVPGPVSTVTVSGPRTMIIKRYTTIKDNPVTVPEKIVSTTKIVKYRTSKTKVIVTATGKHRTTTGTDATTAPESTAPPTSGQSASRTPPADNASPTNGTSRELQLQHAYLTLRCAQHQHPTICKAVTHTLAASGWPVPAHP